MLLVSAPQVSWEDDDEVVQLANDCPFGLGSSVFSNSKRRAVAIAERLEVGMSAINDFATTYMCQSLPFGGVKLSGFDRFAGVEGLRGMCIPKASGMHTINTLATACACGAQRHRESHALWVSVLGRRRCARTSTRS